MGNRPVNFSDPTGHNAECGLGESGCRNGKYTPEDFKGSLDTVLAGFDIATNGGFNRTEKWSILRAARAVGEKFAEERGNGESATDAFTAVYDPITSVKTDKFEYTDKSGNKGTYTTGCKTEVNTITCADFTYWIPQTSVNNIVHELGHVFDPGSGLPQIFVDNRNFILHPDDATGVWNQNPSRSDFETFGDFFLAWTFDVWGPEADTIWPNYESVGSARDWMNTSMDGWLGH